MLRRILGLSTALLVSLGMLLAPPIVGPVAAAGSGQLLESGDATYTLVPAATAIHVTIAVRLQNDKPSSAAYFYFWRDVTWNVQPEAVRVHVTDPRGPLPSSTNVAHGATEVNVHLRSDLLYGQVTTLTIAFDLPDGGPRSPSPVRVSAAFAAFEVWAWGDAGAGSVTVRMPSAYVPELVGSPMEIRTTGATTTLTTGTLANPADFWTSVSAQDAARMASDALTLAGGISLVIKGWPEDGIWRTRTADVLRRGLPELLARIGLPWPIHKELVVSEVYTPDLGGFAGIYSTQEETIQISEQIDNLTIVHEASHAWFNGALFTDRWIGEGLADTYATAVLKSIGLTTDSPSQPSLTDPGHISLASWEKPPKVTPQVEATETYGYNASWWVVQQLVGEIGEARMRKVFAAAAADETAYPGDAPPETVGASDNWQRFLDLVDGIGGSATADDLFRAWVVAPIQVRLLDSRATARAAYADLLAKGRGWAPPLGVRTAMGLWSFDQASAGMSAAAAVLGRRDEIRSAADGLGISPGPRLEGAYEAAGDQFAEVTALAEGELDAIRTMTVAHQALVAPRDVFASIGLIGASPEAGWTAAVAAFEADDLGAARTGAAATIDLMAAATSTGRDRALVTGTALAAGGGAAYLLLRRRRRGRRGRRGRRLPSSLSVPPGTEPQGTEPQGTEPLRPYVTLAAEPPAEAGPTGIAPAEEVEGAADRGVSAPGP